MRRIFTIILILSLLSPSAQAIPQEKYVALTFDDGPSGRYTQRLLDGLAQRKAEATFFLCGYRMAQYPALTQRIFDEGHEIGLHGFSHNDMGKMAYCQASKEIADSLALLPSGCRPTFLRPPGGSCCPEAAQAVEDAGLSILMWSVDPKDWKVLDASAVEAAVLDHVKTGDVILLHDMSDSSVDAALAIIDRLQAQGFQFVTVSALARKNQTRPLPGKTYRSFRE